MMSERDYRELDEFYARCCRARGMSRPIENAEEDAA